MNNTNPMLDESGPEYRAARDGRLGSGGGRVAIQSLATISDVALLSAEELAARLRQVGEERYHHQHPFHLMMHEGQLSRGQLQAWALNRYYYQSRHPDKRFDHSFASEDPDFRRTWRKRVIDHDGDADSGWRHRALDPAGGSDWAGTGTRDGWRRGSARDALRRGCLSDLVKNRSFLEAVASSLTEMFSRDLITLRMDRLRQHYPWLAERA